MDEIGKFYLLNNNYALDLELHNLADERKLDSIKFITETNELSSIGVCSQLDYLGFKLCKSSDGVYSGISPVELNNEIIGYIVTKKKYDTIFSVSVTYELFLIFIVVSGAFIFNFFLIFLSIKKNIEGNTRRLLECLSHKSDSSFLHPKLTIDEYMKIYKKFIEERSLITRLQKDKAYYEVRKNIAEQVAHDIRSPLAAINMAVSSMTEIPELRRNLIKNASRRINDIANNLLSKYKDDDFEVNNIYVPGPELVSAVVDVIISEKRCEYDKCNINLSQRISLNSYACFSKIDLGILKRVLSNLLNNSVESVAANGHIVVSLKSDDKNIEINIEDNGCGIPEDVLPRVMEQGFSYQKPLGAGVGLSFAKHSIEKFGGSLIISSIPKLGTKITIKLLRCEAPIYFCEKILIQGKSHIVILDDDPTIHETWKIKFTHIPGVELCSYINIQNLSADILTKINSKLFLIDYELLNSNITGLDLIEKLSLSELSYLVTSNFEDENIRKKCIELGVKIIPKSYVPYIPIIFQ